MRMHILGALAFLEETWPTTTSGPARDRVRAAARRPVHRHAARGLRRRRDQDRGARRRRRDARLGPPAPQRPQPVVVDPRPQQALASRSTCASPRGSEIAAELAATADIVLENFRPGTMEKWGLGPEDLHARNPRCIYARVSGYGQTGRYARPPRVRVRRRGDQRPALHQRLPRPGAAALAASASATRSPPSPPSRASCSRSIAREQRRRGPGRRRRASSTPASR